MPFAATAAVVAAAATAYNAYSSSQNAAKARKAATSYGTQDQSGTSYLGGPAGNTAQLYQELAQTYANTPAQIYGGKRVADFSPDQFAGFDAARASAYGAGKAYDAYGNRLDAYNANSMVPASRNLAGGISDIAVGSKDVLGPLGGYTAASGNLAAYAPGIATTGAGATLDLARTIPQTDLSGYMNPYLRGVLDPQLEDIARANAIERNRLASQQAKVGAFGGSRSALQQAELERNLEKEFGRASGTAYSDAYKSALEQFRKDQTAIPAQYAAAQGLLSQGQGIQKNAIDAAKAELDARTTAQQQGITAQSGLANVAALENAELKRYADYVTSGKDAYNAAAAPLLTIGEANRNYMQQLYDQAYQDWVNQYYTIPEKKLQVLGTAVGSSINPGALNYSTTGNLVSSSTPALGSNNMLGGALATFGGLATNPAVQKGLTNWFSGSGGGAPNTNATNAALAAGPVDSMGNPVGM